MTSLAAVRSADCDQIVTSFAKSRHQITNAALAHMLAVTGLALRPGALGKCCRTIRAVAVGSRRIAAGQWLDRCMSS